MSLPVSQYEALLEEVRGLRKKAQRVQQLATPLLSTATSTNLNNRSSQQILKNAISNSNSHSLNYKMDSVALEQLNTAESDKTSQNGESENVFSEDEGGGTFSAQMSVSSEPITHENRAMSMLYHGTWPVERTMWNSEPTSLGPTPTTAYNNRTDMTSVMSFASSSGGAPLDRVLSSPDRSRRSSQQLEAKVDMVYSLLSMLGGQEHADTGETLLALSTNPESCLAMRQSGCIPLLVQLVQSDKNSETQKKAAQALHNLVHSNPDEKLKKRETRVLKLLEEIRMYTTYLHNKSGGESLVKQEDGDSHPVQAIANLMKYSFDEGNRQAICQLGGIHTIANLVESEHTVHGSITDEGQCILLRRYSCMALTNLTFGDSGNKALLCLCKDFMSALVVQLQSPCDELRQVTASVLRNLSWRADVTSKEILRNVGAVSGLMKAAMIDNKENTLKSVLSALWNLSAHCTENKSEICSVDGALCFLVKMLSYNSPSKSLTIIENAGGVLRNISSQIAIREDFRKILRNNHCLQILLDQLKSPSLTIVSNACGTLWNLSAKNQTDQDLLWQMGAPTMLRSLNHSKHKMIAMGSSAALKNLLASRQSHNLLAQMDDTAKAMDLPTLPTLSARKQKALLQELEQNLTETFDNIDKDSPFKSYPNDSFCMDNVANVLINKPVKPRRSSSQESHRTVNDSVNYVNEDLNSAFANLNIVEPSTSYQNKTKTTHDYGSSSLPYLKPNVPFVPVKTYSKCSYTEESDLTEQPVNYSRKFVESKSGASNSVKDESFGIYAETDLDQPTDYSLRYAEDDSDLEEACDKIEKTDFVLDTIKTYCTEDTPYETPFNYSTATSMSDLRETALDSEKPVLDNDQMKICKNRTLSQLDEKDHCSVEDISELDNKQKLPGKQVKSQFSSGLASPEKPVNYADEGTPGYFSRVSSFGSLNSIPALENVPNEIVDKDDSLCEPVNEIEEKVLPKNSTLTEGKAVKFEQVVNYAEETPLMFSRSSSLSSLDSVEQHSIHEDRESVISDFSRLTSGLVSPSELPDSPTQTIPPSPRQPPSTSRHATKLFHRSPADGESPPEPANVPKSSVFEDNITKYKEESTPIQFSTATSLSSLTIDEHDESPSKTAMKRVNDTIEETQDEVEEILNNTDGNDDAGTISDSEGDDDILAACISDGMQKHRLHDSSKNLRYKYQPRGSSVSLSSGTLTAPQAEVNLDSVHNYCTEDTPAILSHSCSNSDLSVLTTASNLKKEEKSYLSDDSSNLSGDNENILAECIQSAMPKARVSRKGDRLRTSGLPIRNVQTSSPIKPFSRVDNSSKSNLGQPLSMYYGAKDEVEAYAVENSPCHISFHSSLSDLTVDGSTTGKLKLPSATSTPQKTSELPSTRETTAGPSAPTEKKAESLSSLSGDSLGSLENEQVLLEQCISSGMPKSKRLSNSNKSLPLNVTKPVGVATKQFTANKIQSINEAVWERHDKEIASSKNVNVTSVAKSTRIKRNEVHPVISTTVADVEEPEINRNLTIGMLHNNSLPLKEKEFIEHTRSGYENSTSLNNTSLEDPFNSSEEKDVTDGDSDPIKKIVDSRMLDPDAMIESLDRFTAELVSQAEAAHCNKDGKKFTSSITDGDTWNDDSSPNDLTFPSLSGSAPNVITFRSETEDVAPANDVFDEKYNSYNPDLIDGFSDPNSNDFSSINTSTMTESTLIAVEATKMASVFKNEAALSTSISSAKSLELDQVQPPSNLNSLTSSMTGLEQQLFRGSPKLISRKKSLPTGLLARRALTHSVNQNSSMESLSNLDHINPPSAMGEVFDMIDLESSITSLTSLKSEVADYSTNQPNPIFNVKQPVNFLHLLPNNSYSDLENINPPSIFNEISDMCNSLADIRTEAIGSETENFEDCNTHFIDDTIVPTEDDLTQFSDAQSVTPILSDLSSAETSPKKVKSLSRRLTPKQKRKLVQERYRTYTVAAEMVISMEQNSVAEDDFKTIDSFSECQSVTGNSDANFKSINSETRVSPRTTPKERRKNDKARFQTQVLDQSVTTALIELSKKEQEAKHEVPLAVSNGSPKLSKLSIKRNFMQKRLENKDRFATRTLSESSISPDVSSASPSSATNSNIDLQHLLEKEANRVLKKLKETKSHPDELLDCETLSLISNDEDSDHNSCNSMNYRTYTKSCRSRTIPLSSKSRGDAVKEVSSKPRNEAVKENASSKSRNAPVKEEINEVEVAKPKIIKPDEKAVNEDEVNENESQNKGIRGRRKPLYSRTAPARNNARPIRNITSNLVKNVTSVIKSSTNLKNATGKQTREVPKMVVQNKFIRPPSGKPAVTKTPGASPKRNATKSKIDVAKPPSQALERQGTFTKDSIEPLATKSRIPMSSSSIPAPKQPTSRIARAISQTNSAVGKTVTKVQSVVSSSRIAKTTSLMKSASSDRAASNSRIGNFSRSSSADSRDASFGKRLIHNSSSSQSLKSESKSATAKRSSPVSQRSNSNSSIVSNGSSTSKKQVSSKQVTSKIASLWKKVEEQKKLPTKKDTRVWIQPERQISEPDSSKVVLRTGNTSNSDPTKRVSRLGSFIVMDENDDVDANECNGRLLVDDIDDASF